MYLSLHQDSEIQNLIKSSDNETYISHHDCKFICYRNNCHNTIRSGLEHIVICGTQIMTTVIVTPLGVFAIAANSFAITAESLCICPVWDCRCCTTLVGQSIGADRRKLVRSFARITIFIWYDRYGVIGVLMYLFAPKLSVGCPRRGDSGIGHNGTAHRSVR